jgi:hypothetical protein
MLEKSKSPIMSLIYYSILSKFSIFKFRDDILISYIEENYTKYDNLSVFKYLMNKDENLKKAFKKQMADLHILSQLDSGDKIQDNTNKLKYDELCKLYQNIYEHNLTLETVRNAIS